MSKVKEYHMPYYNGSSNIPCKYFQQGKCTRGNNCKFAHVYVNENGSRQSQSQESGSSEADNYKNFVNPNAITRIEKTILTDLVDAESFQRKPLSSAYSYGTPCTVNLINGRDYSPEESRLQYYEAQKNGLLNQYEVEMKAREKDMEKCFAHIRSHPDWAARFLQKTTKELTETGQITMKNDFVNFPLDLTGQMYDNTKPASVFGSNPFSTGKSASPFGNTVTNVNPGAFGQTSFGSNKAGFGLGSGVESSGSAFGAPSFGNINGNTQTTGGVFGKPVFGAASSSSAFGAPATSATNNFTNSADPSTNSNSLFGKPQFGSGQANAAVNGVFGKPAFGASPFGNQQPAAFGSNAATGAFGATQKIAGNSSFGAAQNNFNTNSGSSPFGSTQGNITSSVAASPFASLQKNAQNNAFTGQSPFGSSNINQKPGVVNASPFSNLQTATKGPENVFGSGMAPKPNSSMSTSFASGGPFAFGNQNTNNGSTSSPFATVNTNQFNGFASPTNSNVAAPNVVRSGLTPRFVQGVPSKDDKLSPEELDREALEQFESGKFILGKVPDVPPPAALIV